VEWKIDQSLSPGRLINQDMAVMERLRGDIALLAFADDEGHGNPEDQ
jgi:hypothetical protein